MELNNYKQSCRFCLKSSMNMQDIFLYTLQPRDTPLIDFVSKLTELNIVKGEFLPNTSCRDCIDTLNSAYDFAHMCIVSDDVLKKEETRREFRKIEREALSDLDENEAEFNVVSPFLGDGVTSENILSVKREDMAFQENSDPSLEYDDISDCDQQNNKTENFYTTEVLKIPTKTKDRYTCHICEMKFSNKIKFFGHQKMHDDTKPFKCLVCMQGYLKEAHLRVHERCHSTTKDKKFACTTCNKPFMYEYLLKQHEFTHSDKKPYPCPKCEKGCLTSENLKRHMNTHDENYIKKIHRCAMCKKEFRYPSSLVEHIKLHTGEKPHLCSICGKGFRQVGSLHFHQRIHSGLKPFKCELCPGYFKSRSLLKVHMRKHTNERPFICDSCGMAFMHSHDLKCHLRVHTGERPILCPLCGKRMSTTGQLTVHLRTHTGEKPFKCETCQKAFATKTMVKKHQRIHTGEKPYACEVCHKKFNQMSSLKTHSNLHNMQSDNDLPELKIVDGPKKRKIQKAKTIVKMKVTNSEKSHVKTGFTLMLPAPIPLLADVE